MPNTDPKQTLGAGIGPSDARDFGRRAPLLQKNDADVFFLPRLQRVYLGQQGQDGGV